MFMLHKKGDPSDLQNYRGIALVNCITKIFTSIINDRLRYWAESNGLLPEEQAGFRENRSCDDNIFILQTTLQMLIRHKGASALILFIDFKRAFDSVPHEKLWCKLASIGLCPKLVNILIKLYASIKMYIKSNNDLSDPIEITEGVLQGEVLSPLLFILYISDMVDYFEN
ncbi:GSCOCG00012496001-RA-CDS [Cotesia congregata]|nr:GSCOCG00012496001-RA-CDS [Cotesia congregata]